MGGVRTGKRALQGQTPRPVRETVGPAASAEKPVPGTPTRRSLLEPLMCPERGRWGPAAQSWARGTVRAFLLPRGPQTGRAEVPQAALTRLPRRRPAPQYTNPVSPFPGTPRPRPGAYPLGGLHAEARAASMEPPAPERALPARPNQHAAAALIHFFRADPSPSHADRAGQPRPS